MKNPKNIVLTGASGGLGQALAAELAAPGRHVLLLGRDGKRLTKAADAVREKGGEPHIAQACHTRPDQLAEVLRDFDAHAPVDLMIANAGVKTGNRGGVEPAGQTARVVQVNLLGTIHGIEALMPRMQARGRGTLAIVGSLAAIAPHADLLSYSATKAGLHAYAKALRRSIHGTGLRVVTVIPGFMDTPMTDRQLGPAPLCLPADRAAQIIARGLARGRTTIAFPKSLIAASWLAERLPAPLSDAIMRQVRAEILPDPDEESALRN
ncbi:Oxidoreductase, short-chain dehydrogenase/reductase family [Rhodovulum sp. P5]|uniref:SDR family NAD(P)-dependent oxidoreductase n=1 Tax=Rhodovulum sp. P5 TaxID=1564506 RepID=UPI0009C2BBC9|nr:SDR family NAD(P)-dependent oxidoreductase [Rhodovulum sp. P5]ARE39412.1 Oxidoreductase, short-chain dehydrogenase/reductase family [Rhodovulum sp. P5]